MLINSFFTPIDLPSGINLDKNDNNTEFTVRVSLNKNHDIFTGHFPDQPIVPGVTYIEMIREIIEAVFNKIIYLREASNIKFLAITNPLLNPVLSFNFRLSLRDDDLLSSRVAISVESGTVIKFDGKFTF
jgi:3-hydroxyacyl-[acyl-carrier-protein] dehydratase